MNKQEDPDPNPTQDDQETIAPTPSPTWEETPTVAPNLSSCENSFGSTNFIGEYELMEEIARGGMGVVFKARHRNLNRIAAVKMILGGRFSSAEEVQRFRIEAESAAKLDHPAIVPIYEIGEHEGQAFFAMKYIDGGSLAEKVTQFSDRPRDAAALIAKVAEGVNHAHQRAVLHRDLKPANILLDRQGQPWVADLGLAKSTSGETDITRTGAVLGTPTYMPPEQAAGKSVTTAADIYSLGAILYQLLSGRPPYQGDTSVSIVMQVIEGPPPSLRSLNRDLDRDLELIVQKCLERNPDDRYTSAQDLANDLQKWLDGEPISIKPPSIGALVNTWFRRNEKLVYAIFAVFVGILLCAPAVLTFTNGEQNDVYQKFSVTEKPFLYKIEAPEWLVAASVIFLILVLIPSIGFLNAAISRPKTFLDALWAGVSTSVVLSVIFYFLLGWMIFLNGANNYINQD
ncbi:MAG: serine/threonine-protein kinase, partial [Planctomycetota bacterium]